MAAKVATKPQQSQTSQIKPFRARKESPADAPIVVDTIAKIKEEAAALVARLRILSPKAIVAETTEQYCDLVKLHEGKANAPRILLPFKVASQDQVNLMRRMAQIDKEIDAMEALQKLAAERESIKRQLDKCVDESGAAELIASSDRLRYCYEPSAASVSVSMAGASHKLRQIK